MKKFLLYGFVLVLSLLMSIGNVAAQELVLPVQIPTLKPNIVEAAEKAVPDLLERPEKATKQITKAISLAKNDKGQLMALAMWFTEQENGMQAAKYVIDKVYENNATDVDVMLVAGDIYGTMGLWGRAGQKYDQVLEIDPNNIYAITQGARIYKNHNADASLALWEQLLTLEPNNTLAMRNIGDIHYEKNHIVDAVEFYGKYFDNVEHTKTAINAPSMEKYLISLFFTEGQDERLKQVGAELYDVDPSNLVYQRFAFFGSIINYDSVPATLQRIEQYASYVTEGRTPESSLISQDYRYAYQLTTLNGQFDKSVGYLTRAVDAPSDPLDKEMLQHAAFQLSSLGQNFVAADMYRAYIERAGLTSNIDELLQVAVFYRQSVYAATDPAEKKTLEEKALAALDELLPSFDETSKYKLLLERAHTIAGANAPGSPEAMQAYGEALDACTNYEEGGETVKNVAIMLMNYHANVLATTTDEDATWANIRKYCDIVKDIDPFNDAAMEIDDILIQFGK